MFLVTWGQGPRWDIATMLTQWPQWEEARVPSPTQRDACGSRRSGVLIGPQSLDSLSHRYSQGVRAVRGCASVFKQI